MLHSRPFRLCPSFRANNVVSIDHCTSNNHNNGLIVHSRVRGVSGGALGVISVPCNIAAGTLVRSVIGTYSTNGLDVGGVRSGASTGIRVHLLLRTGASDSGAVSTLCTFAGYRIGCSPGYYIISGGGPYFVAISRILHHGARSALGLLRRRLLVRHNRLGRRLRFTSLRGVFVRREVCGSSRFRGTTSISTTLSRVSGQLRPFGGSFIHRIAHSSLGGLLRVGVTHVLGFGDSGYSGLVTRLLGQLSRVGCRLRRVIRCAVS